ncbi:MAG TPA: hypothetical protein VFF65_02595 [Phycisphaerales bacterium]|nr:hypothetical protein [Phycisphaerales bacterium]
MAVYVRCAAVGLLVVAAVAAPSTAQESCTQYGQVLMGATPEGVNRRFGGSVAISNDAQWIAVGSAPPAGAPDAAAQSGATIYRRVNGVYTLDRPLLVPDEWLQGQRFGIVRLSGDGRTLALASLASLGVTATFDRAADGAWVRVPGVWGFHRGTGLYSTTGVVRPVDLNADGTLAVVNTLGTITLYTRPAGFAPGTPWMQGQTLRTPDENVESATGTTTAGVALSADGTVVAVSTLMVINDTQTNILAVYRRSGGDGGGVWSLERELPASGLNTGNGRVEIAISADNALITLRGSNAGTVTFRKVAGEWTQLNPVPMTLGNGQLALGLTGAWGIIAEPDGVKVLRPMPDYSWAITTTIPDLYPYAGDTYTFGAGAPYHRVALTPDGRWGVVGTDAYSPIINGTTLSGSGFARVVDLRPTAVPLSQPQGQVVAAGTAAVFTFTVQAEAGTVPQFQWRCNGVPIYNGATGTGSIYSGTQTGTLTVSNVGPADQFAVFDCIVDACGGLVSAAAPLSVQLGGLGTGCLADLGQTGAVPGQDGALNNNDFIVFIDYFFNQTGCP